MQEADGAIAFQTSHHDLSSSRERSGIQEVWLPAVGGRHSGAALGGHLDGCTRCGYRATISYNSRGIATAEVSDGRV